MKKGLRESGWIKTFENMDIGLMISFKKGDHNFSILEKGYINTPPF